MNKNIRRIVTIVTIQAMLIGTGCSYDKSLSASTSTASSNLISENIEKDIDQEYILSGKNKYTNSLTERSSNTNMNFKAQELGGLNIKSYTDTSTNGRNIAGFDDFIYSDLPGVTCFRGGNLRDGGSYGKVEVKEGKLEVAWRRKIGSIDNWTGVGWNGQPSIVQWNSDVIKEMNINSEKKNKQGLKEVIYATLDGNVYFMDLEDGRDTREKLNIGAPIKGSLTVDPRGIPILYVGQGINKNGSKFIDFGYRMFSLTDFTKLYEIRGKDSFSRRSWGAFDSTALIDKNKDSFFLCGENGLLYSGKLNTKYGNGKVEINPELIKYRYDILGKNKRGIENSIAIYGNYGFFADNDGILQCVDVNTLKPMWVININDDTDSTIVLDKENDFLSLYTACEVDHQGNSGYSYVRKIDAASGKILWENKYKAAYFNGVNGGALATPIVGKGDISNLVIFNIARHPKVNEGILVALDKSTGKEVWSLNLGNYCWSSPLAIYTDNEKSYIVQCDSAGKAMLIEGATGKLLHAIELGANVEGTPSAFDDTIVVGTRGAEIVGFKIK